MDLWMASLDFYKYFDLHQTLFPGYGGQGVNEDYVAVLGVFYHKQIEYSSW